MTNRAEPNTYIECDQVTVPYVESSATLAAREEYGMALSGLMHVLQPNESMQLTAPAEMFGSNITPRPPICKVTKVADTNTWNVQTYLSVHGLYGNAMNYVEGIVSVHECDLLLSNVATLRRAVFTRVMMNGTYFTRRAAARELIPALLIRQSALSIAGLTKRANEMHDNWQIL